METQKQMQFKEKQPNMVLTMLNSGILLPQNYIAVVAHVPRVESDAG